jgi:Arc/MetJ-type ribon-helix-helix transcriptional regulator
MDRELTITLSDEQAHFIEQRVESGEFASVDAAIVAAIDALAIESSFAPIPDDVLRRLVEEGRTNKTRHSPEQVHSALMAHHLKGVAETPRR